MAVIVLSICASAGAQTPSSGSTTTSALTPAQQRAQERAAQQAAAKQAAEAKRQAAQQAAEARREAAQQAAQNRKAGTTAGATAATTQRPGTTATNGATTLPATAATTTSTPAAAGAAYRPGNNKSATTSPANAAGTGGAAVGSGTLAWGPRVYTSTGCTHNGNSAVCTFTFVNQGNEATLSAGGAGELSGIQLVDDAHVPHRWDGAHFLDKYGTQQPRLIVQQGDTGTYVVTFPNVNPQVTSAEFHLRNQIIGGVTFSGAQSTAAAGTAPTGAK
ncbi:MAG: hypothetical protein ACLPZY_11125 [Terracidiphilus sp.]